MRIIEKIDRHIQQGTPFFSFEFFPPKTENGLHNLYARIDRMARMEPAFVDITWGAGGSTSELSLEISATIQRFFGLEVMMHLTCTNMDTAALDRAIHDLRESGVMNILALRGDPPEGRDTWEKPTDGFAYAADLTRHIRAWHGDYFGIGVAGYPEGHPEAPSREQDVEHLRQKVDAGADFVVTQLVYDVDEYVSFVERCRAAGVTCPIIPGIMPIHNYDRFKRFTDFCGTKIPPEVTDALEPIQHDDEAVRDYGVRQAIEMARKLFDAGAPGLHFYTLNLETSTARVLEGLGLVGPQSSRRDLPWRRSAVASRSDEEVRPIFWSNRPKSYLARTMDWDEFPNGRWGSSASPSFGDLSDYYLMRNSMGAKARRKANREMWGEPQSEADVRDVFVAFCRGEISRLPWVEQPLQRETTKLNTDLLALNEAGILTINSQPRVDGAPSADPDVGWGGPGGVIYQKAYLEFFIDRERLPLLLDILRSQPSWTYHCIDAAGESYEKPEGVHTNAVTWGIFPGKEVVQPTVVDSEAFLIWKDEAFHLWLEEWASLYEPDSPAPAVLRRMHDSHFLVNIVDNDFQAGDLFGPLRRLL